MRKHILYLCAAHMDTLIIFIIVLIFTYTSLSFTVCINRHKINTLKENFEDYERRQIRLTITKEDLNGYVTNEQFTMLSNRLGVAESFILSKSKDIEYIKQQCQQLTWKTEELTRKLERKYSDTYEIYFENYMPIGRVHC